MPVTSVVLTPADLATVKRSAAAANLSQSAYIRACITKRGKQAAAGAAGAEIQALSDAMHALISDQTDAIKRLTEAIESSTRLVSFREFKARAVAESWPLPSDQTDAYIELARGYYMQYRRWPDPANKRDFGAADGVDLVRLSAAMQS